MSAEAERGELDDKHRAALGTVEGGEGSAVQFGHAADDGEAEA